MGMEIAKIANEAMRKIAEEIDNGDKGNKNGILDDGEELSAFFEQQNTTGIGDTIELKGAQGTDATAAVTNPIPRLKSHKKITKPAGKESKDDKKLRNDVKNKVKELVKQSYINSSNLMDILKNNFTNPIYAPILDDVQKMLDAVEATNYNSKSDVEKIKDKVKGGKLSGFQDDVLDALVEEAKSEQITKEYNEMYNKYKELKKAATDNGKNINFTQIEKNVKDAFKGKGSYYEKEALKAFQAEVKKDVHAYAEAFLEDTKGESEKAVKKNRLDKMAEKDKILSDVIKNDKQMNKLAGKRNKFNNNKDNVLAHISEDDMKKALGEDLFNKLNRSYLLDKKNEDGTYDVREIAETMKERYGYDYTESRSKNKNVSEKQQALAAMRALTGLSDKDFTEKDLEKIRKFTALDKEGKNHNPIKKPIDLLKHALAGALGVAGTGRLKVNQNVNLFFDTDVSQDMISTLESYGAEITKGEQGIRVRIHQSVLRNFNIVNILAGAGIGVLQSVLLQVIFGDDKEFEKSCLSTTDFALENPDIDKYEAHLKGMYPNNPEKVETFINLAKSFQTEDGKWDAAAYADTLNKIAGRGSILNCDEIHGGMYELSKTKDETEKPEKEEIEEENIYSQKDDCQDIFEDVPTIDGRHTTWSNIAAQYECLDDSFTDIVPKRSSLDKKIRALKIAQAITNGDYSLETISKLVEMSYLHPEEMKNVEGLDYNVYKNTLQANVLGQNVKVPKELAGCQRNESISLVARNVRRTSRVINQNGSAADRACVGSNCTYYAKFNGVEHNYGSDMAARDKAVAEFRAKHPNARVEKDQK